ncbi:MAG: cupin domain-containing protein, partial [Anaerolineales bacterium]
MAKIFRTHELEIEERPSHIPDFLWKRRAHLGELANAQYLHFDMMVLPSDKFSYPYHSHRNAEELFYIIEGAATLRTPLGIETVHQGDLLHFEQGAAGAHQLYNHTYELKGTFYCLTPILFLGQEELKAIP